MLTLNVGVLELDTNTRLNIYNNDTYYFFPVFQIFSLIWLTLTLK